MPQHPDGPRPGAPGATGGAWLFGRYRLEPSTRRLHAGDRVQELDARAMAVLECLLRRPERVVPRATLTAEAWPGVDVVFDSAVSKTMRRLRTALGDHQGTVLQTIYGEGYRLALPATLLPPVPGSSGHDLTAAATPRESSSQPAAVMAAADATATTPPPAPELAPVAPTHAAASTAPRPAPSRATWMAWLPWVIALATSLLAGWLAWLLLHPAGAA